MKIVNERVNKPISLEGCIQVLNKMNVDYSEWNINKIFIEVENILKDKEVTCMETFVQPYITITK